MFVAKKVKRTHTEETKKKISLANLGRKHTESAKAAISRNNARYWKGKNLTEEHRAKLVLRHSGMKDKSHTTDTRNRLSESKLGEKNPNWLSEEAQPYTKYHRVHRFVYRQLGKPSVCENCGSTDESRYEWANISQLYLYDLEDWIRLCVRCHRRYDLSGVKVSRNFQIYHDILNNSLSIADYKGEDSA